MTKRSLFWPSAIWAVCFPLFLVAGSGAVQGKESKSLTYDELFPSDRVLDVQITLAEDDWDNLRNQSQSFFDVLSADRKDAAPPSRYTYVPASVTIDGVRFPKVGLRKKGFIGSQDRNRPSLKVKLNFVDAAGKIDGLNNLTFNNNKQDVTLCSQFLGYRVYDQVGLPSCRCAYASVTVNGNHLGVYSHVETARRPLVRREFGDDTGTLYEGTVTDFREGWENSFENKFGDDAPGREKIKLLIDVLASEDDESIEQRISELVDIDSFYRFWALESLLGFWDGYVGNRNNFFVYLNPKNDKLHFLPWGADAMFEKHSQIDRDPRLPLSVKTNGYIAYRLYQTDAGKKRYRKTLLELLEKHWDEEKLSAELDRIEELVKPHLGRRQENHPEMMVRIRDFVETRRTEIMDEISDGMPDWDRRPEMPPVIGGRGRNGPNADLLDAAKRGDVTAVEKMLNDGADINARGDDGSSAIIMATLSNEVEMAKLLIEKGANVSIQNKRRDSPLHIAAFLGRHEITQLLLDGDAKLNLRNADSATALDVVRSEWSKEVEGIMDFLQNVLGIEIDNDQVKSGRIKVETLLVDKGAKPASELPKLAMTIWQAAKAGDLGVLKRLTSDKTVDLNGTDDKGVTPLSWAAITGKTKAAALLIEAGADVNGRNQDKGTPLHSAAFMGRLEVVELLVAKDADVNATNAMGHTPLSAVESEWSPQVEGIVKFVARFLKTEVDMDDLKAARPKVAALLREHGAE